MREPATGRKTWVVPHWIEIWVSGAFRLHDRTVYEQIPEGWRVTKRYP